MNHKSQSDVYQLVSPSEVNLPFRHFHEVLTPLDEGINLCKNAGFVQHPSFIRESIVDFAGVCVYVFPLMAATQALL